MNFRSTAILLFTRSAKEEAAFKRVSGKKRLNKRFFKTLIDQTRKTARATGLPLFTADHQHGNTFGERLTHALQEVFDQGFERVITIGNDSPELTPEILLHAANALDHHELVLGPAKDGGTYLIGLHKYAFDQHALAKLNWSGEFSFRDLMNFAQGKELSTFVGDELQDIDDRRGLNFLLNVSGDQFQSIKLIVVHILATFHHFLIQENAFEPSPVRYAFGLKAPPHS